MAFSPGMGLSFGQGDAVYVGLIILILTGPTAFATPPALIRYLLSKLLLLRSTKVETRFSAATEAVALPSANAIPCVKNRRRRDSKEDDDDGDVVMISSPRPSEAEGDDELLVMCNNLLDATEQCIINGSRPTTGVGNDGTIELLKPCTARDDVDDAATIRARTMDGFVMIV